MSRELGILFKPDMHLAIREGRPGWASSIPNERSVSPALGANISGGSSSRQHS